MLISMIGAFLIQTSGGRVTMREVNFTTSSGLNINAYLLTPKGASAEHPVPAIVTSHGLLNNKEMQDLNYVELARRGYVVLAIDMLSHGKSDPAGSSAGTSMSIYDSVVYLQNIDYVDKTRIGITGHSAGGLRCSMACDRDNQNETPLIAAALINSTDPTYADADGNFINAYGDRDVGLIAGQYDEFGFYCYDADGKQLPRPAYIHCANAQSFLYFGTDPAGQPERAADTVYTQQMGGREAMRVIYTPNIIHPWSHFSARSTKATIEFFDQALGAPNPIPAGNQIWQWKVVFNTIGLIGFFMFLVNLAIVLTSLPFFAPVAGKDVAPIEKASRKSTAWFWISLCIGAVYGAVSYLPITQLLKSYPIGPAFLGQTVSRAIAVWAASCGVVALICMLIGRKLCSKEDLVSAADSGLKTSLNQIVRTVILAVVVVACAFGWVFLANFFCHTDFRIWVFGVKSFTPLIARISIPLAIIFCVFYILSSLSVNCANYRKLGGKEWLNTTVLAIFTGMPAYLLCAVQYFTFFATGNIPFTLASNGPLHLFIVVMFPMLAILPISVVVTRKIYKATGNPYLGGIINAIVVALVTCANTVTYM